MIRPTPDSVRAREFSPELLEEELGRVHARVFARLLCRAALLRLRAGAPAADLARWRCAARQARALAEVDGFESPGLLRHALARAPENWVQASRLAAEAFLICPAQRAREGELLELLDPPAAHGEERRASW